MSQTILILGATGYAGRIISRHFASLDFKLLLCGRNSKSLSQLKNQLKGINTEVDVEIIEFTSDNFDSLVNQLGYLDYDHVINCIGVQGASSQSFDSWTLEDLVQVMRVNLYLPIEVVRTSLSKWDDENYHSIILFSGGGGTSPRPNFIPYSLSKTALVRFAENCALLLENRKISINTIAPGIMPSNLLVEISNNLEIKNTSDFVQAQENLKLNNYNSENLVRLCDYLIREQNTEISGKLISPIWDAWESWFTNDGISWRNNLLTLTRNLDGLDVK